MFHQTKRILVAALLVAAAIATPPAADARILPDQQAATASAQESNSALTPVRVARASSGGFDWGDAGIGAAVTVALMGAGTAVLAGRRRARTSRGMAPSAVHQTTGGVS